MLYICSKSKIMKSILFLALSLFLFNNTYAGSKDDLVGSWLFESLSFGEAEDLGEEGEKIMATMVDIFKGTIFDFRVDDSYSLKLMGQEDYGTWEYEGNKEVIVMHSKLEGDNEIKVVSVSEDKLVLDLDGTFITFLKQVGISPEGSLAESSSNFMDGIPAIKIDKNLMANKWQLIRYETEEERSELVENVSNEMAKTVTYHIKPNGKYKYKALGVVTKGKWEIVNDGLGFQVTAKGKDGGSLIWFVHELSDDQLIMQRRKNKKKWVFGVE